MGSNHNLPPKTTMDFSEDYSELKDIDFEDAATCNQNAELLMQAINNYATQKVDTKSERLMTPEKGRKMILPILHDELDQMYVEQCQRHWTNESVRSDCDNQKIIESIPPVFWGSFLACLSFFVHFDEIVNSKFLEVIISYVAIKEARDALYAQINIENTHNRSYADFILRLVPARFQNYIIDGIKNFKSIAMLNLFLNKMSAVKDKNGDPAGVFNCIGLGLSEGELLQGTFAQIVYYTMNTPNHLATINKYVMADENGHFRTQGLFYRKYLNHIPRNLFVAIVKFATHLTICFNYEIFEFDVNSVPENYESTEDFESQLDAYLVDDCQRFWNTDTLSSITKDLSEKLKRLDANPNETDGDGIMGLRNLRKYIKQSADKFMIEFGEKPIYSSYEDPSQLDEDIFPFMVVQSVGTRSNFYETENTEYLASASGCVGEDDL